MRRAVIVPMMLSALVLAACTSDDDEPTAATSGAGGPATISAPLVTSAFCTEMLRLEEAATAADLATAYRALLPEVPEEILPEFEVLIARVDAALGEGDPPDPTVADESAFRVAAFVDLECRVTAQSPLPAPVESVDRP